MSSSINWEQLEERFYSEEEGQKEAIIEELKGHFIEAIQNGGEAFMAFAQEARENIGGIFIPYVFWVDLKLFIDDEDNRALLFEDIRYFTESNFEDDEKKKMKSLLITYFAQEKEFEIDKIQNLVINKSHPTVQEYFRKLISFAKKNQVSVNMYIEKFQMLKDRTPDFELLRMPVMKLKEHLELA